jgi:hypothetical protein
MPPSAPLLSRRQRQLVEVLERLTLAAGGRPPTLRETAAAMGVHHTRVFQLVRTAAARGAVTFSPFTSRSVRVTINKSDCPSRKSTS